VLTLSGGDLQGPTRFTRVGTAPGGAAGAKPGTSTPPAKVGAAPAGGAASTTPQQAPNVSGPDKGIHGKWRDAGGAVIEFRADGTGGNRRGTFRYTARDGVLMFHDGTTSMVLDYQIDGDQLRVESQGQSATFTRAEDTASLAPKPGTSQAAPGSAVPARRVVVNGTPLAEATIARLEQAFRVRAIPGEYWYDAACGAWGVRGGPAAGFLPAGMQLGGPLKPDASGGGTNVFINGRELHPLDVAALQRITLVLPGRYWVDAMGNCGYEGNPAPFLNLVQLANAVNARSGGSYHTRNDFTGIGSGGDGKTSYVMGKDWSVIIGE
jgi:hypothetical protein